MTKDETLMLVQLVATNKYINNKATNATNNKLKEQAWQTLTNEFNSSVTSFTRTPSQLRLKWENLKKSARKRCANMRSSLNKVYKLHICKFRIFISCITSVIVNYYVADWRWQGFLSS